MPDDAMINKLKRCVAQFGRALRSGRRGRRFKSCRIDMKGAVFRCLFYWKNGRCLQALAHNSIFRAT